MPLLSIRATHKPSTYLSTAILLTAAIRVADEDHQEEKGGHPAHWTSDNPVRFQNPWPSWRQNGRMDTLSMFAQASSDMPALHLESIGVPKGHAHLLDWWDARRHFTGRGVHDQGKTLWSSWAVEGEGKTVYFAGDTGYRSVKDGEDEAERPVCPAFKEIGERIRGFDRAMIPIGAYEPRWFMSTIHCAPQDSVRIFKDIKAVAMHWGFAMDSDDGEVTDPAKRLAEECKEIGIDDGDFLVSNIGETKYFEYFI
ncbi:hypothetical protein IW261DRAFT_1565598 [Armillaria novae-zelandiae]|uniref:Metallo-beta-lactamase domain-containing protein n=1 Tax=Armillaria novae-zelandiae TaxID=153914 RepID=A0AA39P629_9AGAR|nr:hypothetical protein IW261DRAFT_1565598 [Armillaria novae-zelandiae]